MSYQRGFPGSRVVLSPDLQENEGIAVAGIGKEFGAVIYNLTRTTSALLNDLADEDAAAWEAIDARYRPVLIGFGMRLGLDADDAADAAQEALSRFALAYRNGGYDRERGRLGSWLLGIARNCIRDVRAATARKRAPCGQSALADLEDDHEAQSVWAAERDQHLLTEAMNSLRHESEFNDRTIRTFELLTVHGLAPKNVAQEMGVSMNEVYLAKHRCLKRLRAIVVQLTEAFDTDG